MPFKKGHRVTPEMRKKISDAHRGRRCTTDNARRLGRFALKGNIPWNKGLKGFMAGEKNAAWRGGIMSNPQYVSWMKNKRNRLKRSQNEKHTFEEWESLKAKYAWMCLCCKKHEPEIRLTEDHIIPVSKGGSDDIKNIQPLCSACNARKHTDIVNYKIKQPIL